MQYFFLLPLCHSTSSYDKCYSFFKINLKLGSAWTQHSKRRQNGNSRKHRPWSPGAAEYLPGCPFESHWPLQSQHLTTNTDMLCQEHQFGWGRFFPHRLSSTRQQWHVGQPKPEPSWKLQPILPSFSDSTCVLLHIAAALQTQEWEHP